jgi:DeoR/GlpR family transcriptional regulator of sugar metabolism
MTEVQGDRSIMAAAREIIVLADHTKFGKIATVRQAPIEKIRRLITDSGAPEASVAALRERGVEVVSAQRGMGVEAAPGRSKVKPLSGRLGGSYAG